VLDLSRYSAYGIGPAIVRRMSPAKNSSRLGEQTPLVGARAAPSARSDQLLLHMHRENQGKKNYLREFTISMFCN